MHERKDIKTQEDCSKDCISHRIWIFRKPVTFGETGGSPESWAGYWNVEISNTCEFKVQPWRSLNIWCINNNKIHCRMMFKRWELHFREEFNLIELLRMTKRKRAFLYSTKIRTSDSWGWKLQVSISWGKRIKSVGKFKFHKRERNLWGVYVTPF